MKRKLALMLAITCLAGTAYVGNSAFAEPPAQPVFKSVNKSDPAPKFQVVSATMKCMPGYNRTEQHVSHVGGIDRMKCLSPTYECPHKSKVKDKNGTPAYGQGIDIKKVPVGAVGDSNKFKIEYSCTYLWAQK